MKYSVLGKLFVGLACIMAIGCSNSEISTAPESQLAEKDAQLKNKDLAKSIQAPLSENLTTYLQGVEDKLVKLKEKHAQLVGQVPEAGPGTESKGNWDAQLDELTKKGEELQFQIEAMKSAKGEDHSALQVGLDKSLADLDESYDTALAKFAG